MKRPNPDHEVCRKCGRTVYKRTLMLVPGDPNCVHRYDKASNMPKGHLSWDDAEKFRGAT